MRLQPIPPDRFDDDQRALYDRIQGRTAQSRGFRTAQPDGAMIGPYNAMLHHPDLGSAMWSMIEALSRHGRLDACCQDVAVLVVGVVPQKMSSSSGTPCFGSVALISIG